MSLAKPRRRAMNSENRYQGSRFSSVHKRKSNIDDSEATRSNSNYHNISDLIKPEFRSISNLQEQPSSNFMHKRKGTIDHTNMGTSNYHTSIFERN
jgi:hypothetical protein